MTFNEIVEQLAMLDAPDPEKRIQRIKNILLCWAKDTQRELTLNAANVDLEAIIVSAAILQLERSIGNGMIN